jgi:hypothetical protein
MTSPPNPLSCKERGEEFLIRIISEISPRSYSPFPCREGGWGVRSQRFLRENENPLGSRGDLKLKVKSKDFSADELIGTKILYNKGLDF